VTDSDGYPAHAILVPGGGIDDERVLTQSSTTRVDRSALSPRELIFRALEESKISIFLNEWLEAVEEGDAEAAERLMEREHPGAPRRRGSA
jgi:hypothetical protein